MICIKLLKAQSDQTKVRYAEGATSPRPLGTVLKRRKHHNSCAMSSKGLGLQTWFKLLSSPLDPCHPIGTCENKLPITSITLPNQGRVPLWSTLKMLLARCFDMDSWAGLPWSWSLPWDQDRSNTLELMKILMRKSSINGGCSIEICPYLRAPPQSQG